MENTQVEVHPSGLVYKDPSKLYLCWWDKSYANPGHALVTADRFLAAHAGYSHKDLKAIAAMGEGETLSIGSFGSHFVTRLPAKLVLDLNNIALNQKINRELSDENDALILLANNLYEDLKALNQAVAELDDTFTNDELCAKVSLMAEQAKAFEEQSSKYNLPIEKADAETVVDSEGDPA